MEACTALIHFARYFSLCLPANQQDKGNLKEKTVREAWSSLCRLTNKFTFHDLTTRRQWEIKMEGLPPFPGVKDHVLSGQGAEKRWGGLKRMCPIERYF